MSEIDILHDQWVMSAEILPLNTKTDWGSIIHVSIGGDVKNYGDRTPGLWFHSESTEMRVSSAVHGKSDFYIRTRPLQESNFSLISFNHYQIQLRECKNFNPLKCHLITSID